MECFTCSEKPGAITLCTACLHNRTLVDRLNVQVKELTLDVAARETIIGKLGRIMLSDDAELEKFVNLLDRANGEIERLRALNSDTIKAE
jgi:hypothetical protein